MKFESPSMGRTISTSDKEVHDAAKYQPFMFMSDTLFSNVALQSAH